MKKCTTGTTLPAILRIQACADHIGVSRAFLYQLIDRGELPRIKLGPRAAGIRRADLDAWVSSRTATSATPDLTPKHLAVAQRATTAVGTPRCAT